MEVISENNNKKEDISSINDQNSENIPELKLDEYPFQLITKEQEKKDDQSFNTSDKSENFIPKNKNEKSTEENTNISKKNSIILNTERNERKYSSKIEEIKEEKQNDKNKKKKKINLNFLPPEVYMGENMVRNVYNINPMEVKLKRLEKEIENQYNYDYNKVMQEMKEKFENKKKKAEIEKLIKEGDKKMKEKLKIMEEYRENKMKEMIKKVQKKQKMFKNQKKNNSQNNKSVLNYSKNYIQTTVGNNDNDDNDISTGKKRLPPILNSWDKYKEIKSKKEMNEKNFILDTEENLKIVETEHNENYMNVYNSINQKLQERKKLYEKRNDLHSQYRRMKEQEKKENYLQKDIKHRYNVQLTILKYSDEKNGKLMDKIKKNMQNFNEKKEILKEKEKKKVKEYLKKINKYKNNSKNSTPNKENKRKYFLEMQKININKTNKDKEKRYNEILNKQEDILSIAYDIEKDDNDRKKEMLRNNKMMQDNNKKIYKSFNHFLEKIEKNNINSKNDNMKLKIYNKKVKEELEEKIRKEEEELKRLGL